MTKPQKATITLSGFIINAIVLAHKRSYGRDRYLVTPVEGKGERWVEKVVIEGKV